MKRALPAIVLALVAVLGLGMKYTAVRKALTAQREAIQEAWERVDLALAQRAALVPDLLSAIGRQASQEQDVLGGVTAARAALLSARRPKAKIRANAALDQALGRLLVALEAYPSLRTDKKYRRLLDELAETENRIAVERRRYNETVQRYNTQIELFPDNVVARLAGFTRDDNYFVTGPETVEAPQGRF